MTEGAERRAATRGILYYCVLPGHSVDGRGERHAGRAMALATVAALRDREPVAADFVWPRRGKPFVAGGPDFSVSHSAPVVACVAVERGVVGLDVECDPRADALSFARVFDTEEQELAAQQGPRRVWMAKEAALKAGGGTIERIGSVRVQAEGASFNGRKYFRHDLDIAGRWPACIMTSVAALDLVVRTVDPPA